MKFTINGKELKNILKIVCLDGKYNQGMSAGKKGLPHQVYITATENMLYFHNGDPATYVVYRHRVENATAGGVSINTDILGKYLSDNDVTIVADTNTLRMSIDGSIVTIPVLERIDNMNMVIRARSKLQDMTRRSITSSEETQVTEKLSMSTWIEVDSEDLIPAMNLAEKVGNSVFKLDFNDGDFNVSSEERGQSVSTDITPLNYNGDAATVEVSLPIGNILKAVGEDRVVILYEDERPIVFATQALTILRAPRENAR